MATKALVPVYDLSKFQAVGDTVVEMMGFYSNGTRSRLVDALENCLKSSSSDEITNSDSPDDISFWSMSYTCGSLLQQLQETVSSDLEKNISFDFSILVMYEENMMHLFHDEQSAVNTSSCSRLRKYLFNRITSLQNAINLSLDMIMTEDVPDALSLARNITNSFSGHKLGNLSEVIAVECNKFKAFFDEEALSYQGAVNAMKSLDYSVFQLVELQSGLEMSQEVLSNMSLTINKSPRFLAGRMSKKELSETFLGQAFGLSLEQLVNEGNKLDEPVTEYLNAIEATDYAMLSFFVVQALTNIRTLNSSNIHNLHFMALTSALGDDSIKQVLKQEEDVKVLLSALLQYIVLDVLDEARKMRDLVSGVEFLRQEVNALQDNLLVFESETQMDVYFYV